MSAYERTEFDAVTKRRRWQHAGGRCESCGVDLKGLTVNYDHHVPLRDGGDSSFENARCLCKHCHNAKTFGPDAEKFKVIRKREKRDAGIKKRSKWPTSKQSKYKRKMDGTIVLRER